MRWASLSLAEMIEDMYMSNTSKLKELVGNDFVAQFVKYFDGDLWYGIEYNIRYNQGERLSEYFEFPVPIADIGGATFLASDKAILFMRYIRKHLDLLEQAKNIEEYTAVAPLSVDDRAELTVDTEDKQ